jgi:hypothetical protein
VYQGDHLGYMRVSDHLTHDPWLPYLLCWWPDVRVYHRSVALSMCFHALVKQYVNETPGDAHLWHYHWHSKRVSQSLRQT